MSVSVGLFVDFIRAILRFFCHSTCKWLSVNDVTLIDEDANTIYSMNRDTGERKFSNIIFKRFYVIYE